MKIGPDKPVVGATLVVARSRHQPVLIPLCGLRKAMVIPNCERSQPHSVIPNVAQRSEESKILVLENAPLDRTAQCPQANSPLPPSTPRRKGDPCGRPSPHPAPSTQHPEPPLPPLRNTFYFLRLSPYIGNTNLAFDTIQNTPYHQYHDITQRPPTRPTRHRLPGRGRRAPTRARHPLRPVHLPRPQGLEPAELIPPSARPDPYRLRLRGLAGVTVSTAQAWKYLDTLGFTRRLEIADLRFSDSLQVTALDRAREPDAPASLLIALLRAHIPEKYSSNGHLCDTSKSDELLFHYRQDAQRELAAGHPTLRAIANGTYQPPSQRNLSPADTPSVGAGFKPAHDLSPAGEETQRGGVQIPHNPIRRRRDHTPRRLSLPSTRRTSPTSISPQPRTTPHIPISPPPRKTLPFPISPPPGERHREGALPPRPPR